MRYRYGWPILCADETHVAHRRMACPDLKSDRCVPTETVRVWLRPFTLDASLLDGPADLLSTHQAMMMRAAEKAAAVAYEVALRAALAPTEGEAPR